MVRISKLAACVISGLMIVCAQSDASGAGTLGAVRTILYWGNSITLHGPSESIGWTGNWGMAASEEAKDYVHLLAAEIAARTGTAPGIRVRNIADFERAYATYDVTADLAADTTGFVPDLFVLAIGENVTLADAAQFKAGVLRIIDGVKARNSQALIVVRSCFWADAAKDLALSQVSQQAGALFVNIGALGAVEANYARSERTFANAGVGSHPGDRGMAAISSAIFQALVAQEGGSAPTQTLEAQAGDLPESLRGGLAFWVDANRNVTTDGSGTVTAWHDAREAEDGTAYPRARQAGAELAPKLVTGGDDVAGNKLVDFGPFQSGQWLQWQNADGSLCRIGGIRTVFLVVSCTNGTGFLLGDATGNPGGNYCFHIGNFGADGLATTWFQPSGGGADADHPVRYGFTRVEGLLTDGMRTSVPHAGTLLSIQTVDGVPVASNFCNDRNLSIGEWGVTENRQGGGRIGEALIYTAELSDDQRKQVEDYLMRKWLRKTLLPVRVPAGATLAMAASNALDLAAVTGAGTLEVTGAGSIALPEIANIAVPPIRLAAGVSASGRRPGQPFALDGGSVYGVADGVCARTAQGDVSAVTKTGSGVLTASAIGPGVARVSVEAGALRLSPPLPGAPDVLGSALANGSFEESPAGRPAEVSGLVYIDGQTYAGWSYTYGSSGSGNCGLARYGGAFCNRPPPDGDWTLFLCNDCTVAGTFTVPAAGRYEVSFYTSAAANDLWRWHLYQVLVDGTNVIGSVRTSEMNYQFVTCRTPALEAGAHTLSFQGLLEANRVSLVDGITIRPCIEADEVAVPNGGFEVPSVLTMQSSAERPYAKYQSEPADAGWTFIGDNAGVAEGYGTWRGTGMEEGGHAAFLCWYGGGGSMSVPLTFPTAGLYRVTFKAACRTARYLNGRYNAWCDGMAVDGNPVSVTLGGVEAARPVQPSLMGEFTDYEYVLPPVTNGALTQTLAFEVINNHEWTTVLIDDVRVFRMPAIRNPGFEDDTEEGRGWTLNNGGGIVTGITTPGNTYWNGAIPEGARCLVMANDGSVSQNVTFETSGTYELSLLASQSHATGPGHQFEVVFNGMKVGSVQTMTTAFKRYRFRLPYVAAGQPYALALQGLTPPGTWYASLIDSVVLRKIESAPAAFGAQDFAAAFVTVAEDAKLELDYAGTVELDGLSYGGVPYIGTLTSDNTPFIRGEGSLLVKPKGTVILIQ